MGDFISTPRVYYIARIACRGFLRPSDSISSSNSGVGADRATAGQYYSVSALLEGLQKSSRARIAGEAVNVSWAGVEIVRVEETPSAPRRELVTTGDLSLLGGPVVVTTGNTFLRDGEWTTVTERAEVFQNARKARVAASDRAIRMGLSIGYDVVPVREIPGSVTVKETVLA